MIRDAREDQPCADKRSNNEKSRMQKPSQRDAQQNQQTRADAHSQMVVKNRAESNSSHLFPDYSQQIADRDDNNMTPGPYTPRRLTISALLTHNSQYAL